MFNSHIDVSRAFTRDRRLWVLKSKGEKYCRHHCVITSDLPGRDKPRWGFKPPFDGRQDMLKLAKHELTAELMNAEICFNFVGCVTNKPSNANAIHIARALGQDFYVEPGEYNKVNSECFAPAWHVPRATAPVEKKPKSAAATKAKAKAKGKNARSNPQPQEPDAAAPPAQPPLEPDDTAPPAQPPSVLTPAEAIEAAATLEWRVRHVPFEYVYTDIAEHNIKLDVKVHYLVPKRTARSCVAVVASTTVVVTCCCCCRF